MMAKADHYIFFIVYKNEYNKLIIKEREMLY